MYSVHTTTCVSNIAYANLAFSSKGHALFGCREHLQDKGYNLIKETKVVENAKNRRQSDSLYFPNSNIFLLVSTYLNCLNDDSGWIYHWL